MKPGSRVKLQLSQLETIESKRPRGKKISWLKLSHLKNPSCQVDTMKKLAVATCDS
jgi:hypothetical protein